MGKGDGAAAERRTQGRGSCAGQRGDRPRAARRLLRKPLRKRRSGRRAVKQIRSSNGASAVQRDTPAPEARPIGREASTPIPRSCAACLLGRPPGGGSDGWRSRRSGSTPSEARAGLATEPQRVGRGGGLGYGKTSGRGHKGAVRALGQQAEDRLRGRPEPVHMRMRKLRGPHKKMSMPFEKFRTRTQPVNLSDLDDRFKSGDEVTPESLRSAGLAKRRHPVKVLLGASSRRSSRSRCTRSAPRPRRRSRPPAVPAR